MAADRPARRARGGFSDLTDDGALDEATRRLRRLGADRLLARSGAHDGDEVLVGEISFTWYRGQGEGLGVPEGDDAPERRSRRRSRR